LDLEVAPVKVFVSHSSVDKWAARQICRELAERDIQSFLDEKDIETGDSIDEAVDRHLAECDEVLVLLSPASLTSSWVLIEMGGARALNKRLVPILLHVGANELPMVISRGLARDINDIDKYFDEVVARRDGGDLEASRGQQLASAGPLVIARRFVVGDLVRLPLREPSTLTDSDGRVIGWNDGMTAIVGQITSVVSIEPDFADAVRVAADNGVWVWLMDWLVSADEASG
jgi:hypothetical protein